MTTAFQRGRAAMVIDGVWNYQTYVDAGVDVGVALLPTVSQTNRRMRPLGSYFGWAVSKTATDKLLAARLVNGCRLPRCRSVSQSMHWCRRRLEDFQHDADIQSAPVYEFMRQSQFTEQIPTNRGASQIYLPLRYGTGTGVEW